MSNGRIVSGPQRSCILSSKEKYHAISGNNYVVGECAVSSAWQLGRARLAQVWVLVMESALFEATVSQLELTVVEILCLLQVFGHGPLLDPPEIARMIVLPGVGLRATAARCYI